MAFVVPSQIVTFIDAVFPWAKKQKDTQKDRKPIARDHSTTVSALMELLENVPPELLTMEDSAYIDFLCAKGAIRNVMDVHWRIKDYSIERIPGRGDLNPITLIRRALSQCPDEPLTQVTDPLSFITDDELKRDLLKDLEAVDKALSHGEWKAATVLGGALIEAILLCTLENSVLVPTPPSDLNTWNLHQLIEEALKLNIIKKETAIQARLAKDFRNLIHPGKAVRKKQECTRATALTAAAAVYHVIDELSGP